MRSAASGIWNHSFSEAVNDPVLFEAVCAFAADTSVAATMRAALRATTDFLNIVMTPGCSHTLLVCDCILFEPTLAVNQSDVLPAIRVRTLKRCRNWR